MSSLGVVPNFIASFHSNPLRNGTILFLLLGQESLDPESLVRRLGEDRPHRMAEKRKEIFFFKRYVEVLTPRTSLFFEKIS